MNPKSIPPRREEPLETEVQFDQGTLAIISKAEIDMQIATAHRFPRSITRFREESEALVTLTEDIADECVYRLERRDKDGNVAEIEGPSSRFAEVLASTWGNCRAGARVVDEGLEFVTAQGAFHDLERNIAISYEVKRRIVGKRGNRFSPDMIAVTANAACSIALRNAILKGIPKAFWSSTYESAKRTIMGDYETLSSRRTKILERIGKLGVSQDRVFAKLGVKGIDDITIDHVFRLKTALTAIKDGDTTPEEAFPGEEKPAERSAGAAMNAAISKGAKTESAPPPPKVETTNDSGTPELMTKFLGQIRNASDRDVLAIVMDDVRFHKWTPEDLAFLEEEFRLRDGIFAGGGQ